MTVRQMSFGPFISPRVNQHGSLTGKLGSYRWSFSFTYEEDPFDDEHWLWDYTFIVYLDGERIYGNTCNLSNVAKAVFGEPYVRHLCQILAQGFIDEGPAA